MRVHLFSFRIWPGWQGLTFEAWRDPGAGVVYAVITREMSRNCGMSLRKPRQVEVGR
jgi:hypothetical protein